MTPTGRAASIALVIALAALVLPVSVSLTLAALLVAATIADLVVARGKVNVRRSLPRVLSRGVAARLTVDTDSPDSERVAFRQAQPPDVEIEPSHAVGALDARVVAHRRGETVFAPVTARRTGPLGLGRWTLDGQGTVSTLVYPDVAAAHRLVIALRRGRFRDPGLRVRGPLGLGTEFESIRDYLPDDDVRQINWRATARTGRPMSNVYRVEQDRDVICLLDVGRLMSAPLTSRMTRLDACVDAVTMVALVADELGDRCGVTAFDDEVRRRLAPSRNGGHAVVRTVLDLEPSPADSDYDLAFRTVGGAKRSMVLVCTDLVDEAAARSLVDAIPVLARRHAVIVASVEDPDLRAAVSRPPEHVGDVYKTAAAVDVLRARRTVVNTLRHVGAEVVEAPAGLLGEACVRAYLSLKARARL